MAIDNRKGRNVTEYHPTANSDGPKGQFRSYTSWGRTRQPKNLAGSHQSEVAVSAAAPTTAAHGYATESQRYLHIYAANSEAGKSKSVQVWGYIHAFGKWFELKDSSGSLVKITMAAGDTVVNTTYTGGKAVDICGIDRLYFQTIGAGGEPDADGGAWVDGDTLFAAVNTISVK